MKLNEINTIKKEMLLTIIKKTEKEKNFYYELINKELEELTKEIKKKSFFLPIDLIVHMVEYNNCEYIISEVLYSELEKYEKE